MSIKGSRGWGSIVRLLIKNVYKRRGNNCYVLSIAVSFNRTTVTIIRSSLLGPVILIR